MGFADFVTNVFGKVAGGAAGAIINPIAEAFSAGLSIIDKLVPDKDQAARLKHEIEMAAQAHVAEMDMAAVNADFQLAVAQIEVNKTEAASENLFKSGWRPAIGWVAAAAFGIEYLVRPMLPWVIGLFSSKSIAPMPGLDMGTLMPLVLGLLGLGTMRTWEKTKGLAGK